MDPNRWDRLQRLFDVAIEMKPELRSGFLERECADDSALRGEVEDLLRASDESQEFIEDAIHTTAESAARAHRASLVGEELGGYRIVDQIARGGMGTVYLAEPVEGTSDTRVAIKIVQSTRARSKLHQRFRTEQHILAQLDHPHIARLITVGSTPTQAPYLVMEYVDGVPIDEYVDRERLSTRQRLDLFIPVAAAVHHAHERGVVHRDLKPDNILVTDAGVPKLLDFGIAKLLDPESFPHTLARTGTNVRLMTPTYASPEQVVGDPVRATADVYSLGVILYELLTGRLPYTFPDPTPIEAARIVVHEPPIKPSLVVSTVTAFQRPSGSVIQLTPEMAAQLRRTTPTRVRRELTGDLDSILLRMLEKLPIDRYQSVAGVIADLNRHERHEPVTAHPQTWRYRAGKFAWRHRLVVSVTLVVLVGIVGWMVLRGG